MLKRCIRLEKVSRYHTSQILPSQHFVSERPLHTLIAKQSNSISQSYSRPKMTNVVDTRTIRHSGDPEAPGSFPNFRSINFYAGSQLSRMSWLRQSDSFLNGILTNEKTRFILLDHLNPLVFSSSNEDPDKEGTLATLSWNDIKDTVLTSIQKDSATEGVQLFGPSANGIDMEQVNSEEGRRALNRQVQSLVPTSIAIVFLGIDEAHLEESSLPGQVVSSTDKPVEQDYSSPAGIPYFALSLSYRPADTPEDVELPTEKLSYELTKDGKYDFVDTRALAQAGTWPLHDAAIVAQARSLIDWNERQKFCPACSRRQYSLWGGWKRACASALGDTFASTDFVKRLLTDGKVFAEDGRGICPTPTTLSNFCYPRTDPTVIMGIVSHDGEKILLGRQRKWPKGFYSCLAGFLEPGESLEEAVRREIFEEAGIHVGHVTYHSSQPWPFPANLMMGALGKVASSNETIRLDLDNELEEAKFFTRAEVLEAVEKSSKFSFTKRELAKVDENVARAEQEKQKKLQSRAGRWDQKDTGSVSNVTDRSPSPSPSRKPRSSFKIPGPTAIAHVVIAAWARGEANVATETRRTKM